MKPVLSTLCAAGAALGLAAASPASAETHLAAANAPAEATPRLIFDLYTPAAPVQLERAQYLWGGRRYCWYDGGWRGPGWYWCGYAYRRGFGWGGPLGWRGWVYHRPVVIGRGFHGGYHGRGFQRGHDFHGDHGHHH